MRLLSYFMTLLFVPIAIFLIVYTAFTGDTLKDRVRELSESVIERDGKAVAACVDLYRHIDYAISNDEKLIEIFSANDGNLGKDESSYVYTLLSSAMRGRHDSASAHVVSTDGVIKVSTSMFPDEYDLQAGINADSVLSRAIETGYGSKSSLIHIGDHRMTESGHQVAFSVLRVIFGDGDERLGYAIVDVYTDAIIPLLGPEGFFAEEAMVDKESGMAFSLVRPNTYGPYDKVPYLLDDEMVKSEYGFGSLSLVGVTDPTILMDSGKTILSAFLLSIMIGVAVSVALALLFSHSISKRLGTLNSAFRKIGGGDFSERSPEETGISDFDDLSESFNGMVEQIVTLMENRGEEERKVAEAERKALEAQLDPHFIFNTLSTIKALARLHGEDDIYTISVQLGKLLRSSISNHGHSATIKESLDLAEAYLKIQKIRFNEKLEYEITADEGILGFETPKLIIQPLVENSIRHGFEGKGGKGKVSVSVKETRKEVIIAVEDDGSGLKGDANIQSLGKSGHVGLYNIDRRLYLRYGKGYSFTLKNREGCEGAVATIRIKKEK